MIISIILFTKKCRNECKENHEVTSMRPDNSLGEKPEAFEFASLIVSVNFVVSKIYLNKTFS